MVIIAVDFITHADNRVLGVYGHRAKKISNVGKEIVRKLRTAPF